MKHLSLQSLLIACILFGLNCKKSQVVKSSDAPSYPAFSVSLTNQEVNIINNLMKEGAITSPLVFRSIVDSVRSTGGGESEIAITATKPTGAPGDYYNSEDQYNGAASIPDYPNTDGGDNYATGKKTIYSSFQSNLKFPVRGNFIQVVVPFAYDLGVLASAGTLTITNVRSYTPVQLLPFGGSWGSVTQGSVQYVNGGPGNDPWQQSAGINAYGSAQETRTYLTSYQGTAEISTNANVGAFSIGAKLGANFTISSASNIYNQYNANANGYIYIYGTLGSIPSSQFQGTFTAYDYGILRNQ